jgi:hypothetical protein
MSGRRDSAGEHRTPPPLATFLSAEASRFLAEMRARTAADTVADDCAMGFLGELDEALWVLEEMYEAAENAFAQATRKTDHITDLRRVLYRLHVVLADWEQEVTTGE